MRVASVLEREHQPRLDARGCGETLLLAGEGSKRSAVTPARRRSSFPASYEAPFRNGQAVAPPQTLNQ